MIRKLTPHEIDDITTSIIDSIHNPLGIRDNMNARLADYIRGQLFVIEINPSRIAEFKADLIGEYIKTQISAGSPVGILSSQSLAEDMSQKTLNTFHQAGISDLSVVVGVPRFTELLDVSQNPKVSNCYIHLAAADTIKRIRDIIGTTLVFISFKDIIQSIRYENEPIRWHDVYELVYGLGRRSSVGCFVVSLNHEAMFKNSISCDACVKILGDHNLLAYYNSAGDEICVFTTDYNEYDFLKYIEPIYVQGLVGIRDYCFRTVAEDGRKKWIVETSGSNLKQILSFPYVDFQKTYSNNIWEIYSVFGIEAVYDFLVNEINNLVTSDGGYINLCHINVLVSLMTFEGFPTPISRYGMNIDHYEPSSMFSFEESFDRLITAGVNGTVENVLGVSSSILCGKVIPVGTGSVSLLMKKGNSEFPFDPSGVGMPLTTGLASGLDPGEDMVHF